MRIERILLRDVGPFDDVAIELPQGKYSTLADVYLLTGQNGTGKSTLLYALASAIAGGDKPLLGDDLLAARMRSARSMVAFQSIDQSTFVAGARDLFEPSPPTNPFSGDALIHRGSSPPLHYWASAGGAPRYPEMSAMYKHRRFAWAAFAYSGLRPISEVRITAIQEPANSPFENSLSFRKTADTNLLANWIVSQNYRYLKANAAGDAAEAERRAHSIRRIEQAIAKIVEDPSFGFDTNAKDDDVRVRWQGTAVPLGVLPDGLQSIVSWVADLLMRLDRIPWENDTPVEQREFLLLLDEIDIHLHPAWQRRVLPLVQRLFPSAQIIASTHSPFVVGSLADGRVISLGLEGASAKVVHEDAPQLGISYSAVLRSIFGIESEFDIDTERELHELQAARLGVIKGDPAAQVRLDELAARLASRSEELREIVALELRQLQRQLALRAAP